MRYKGKEFYSVDTKMKFQIAPLYKIGVTLYRAQFSVFSFFFYSALQIIIFH